LCFGFCECLRVGVFREDFLGNCAVTCAVEGLEPRSSVSATLRRRRDALG
jgi:hypothetical protein